MNPNVAQAIETLRRAGFRLVSPVSVRWLTLSEVAETLSVSVRTVQRMVASGELAPVLRWGSEVRISERALAAWTEAHTVSQPRVEHQQTPRACAQLAA